MRVQIPTFRETLELLMRPENRTVFLNIDVKIDNEPERLFTLLHDIISAYPDYETSLGPRLGTLPPPPSPTSTCSHSTLTLRARRRSARPVAPQVR